MGFGGQRGYPGGGGAAGGYDKGHGGAVGGGGYDKGHGGGRGGGFGGGEGRGSGKGSSSSYSHGPPAPPAPPPAPVGYGGYHGSSSSTRGGGGYSSGSTSYGRPAGAGGGSEGYSGYSGSAGGHHSSGSYGSGAGAGGYSHGDRGGGSSYGERGSPPLRLVTPGPCGGAPPRGARRSRSREQTRGPPRLITPGPCGGGPPARGRRSLSRGYTAAAVGAPPRRRSHSRDYGGLPPRGAPPNSRRSPSWDYGSRGHSKDQRTAFPGWKDAGQRGFSQDFGPEEDFAPQPVEEEDGPVADLTVAGCQHDTVAEIVTGDFVQSGINHGRPVYKKKDQVNGTDVLLYFWDDRDGVKYSGWWFGPKVGGEQIWAYHPEREELSPPAYGWQVPFDGPVDQGFTVSMRLATAPPPQSSQSSQSYGGGMMEDKRDLGRRREEEWPPRQEELDWRRRDVNRRRQEEEQRRREDEKRQFEMEMERKRLQQQGQQRAILAIRRCIQKVRSATAETFDDSKRELEEMLHHELDNTGSQRDRIWQESSEGIDQGRRRVEMEYTRNLQKQEYEEKQRKMAEQRRIVEELKKKQWEENERKRREAEKKQKEEEEQKKKEQQQKRIEENRAVLEIRKTMQRIRMAVSKEETEKPDYAELQASLEAVLKEQLNKTGGMKDKLQDESKLEIEKLKMRLDLQGKEKEKKEAAVQILKDLEELLETAEANVQKYASSLDSLSAKGETTVMDVEESVEAVRPLKTSAQNSTNACTQFVKNKSWEVRDVEQLSTLRKLTRRSVENSQKMEGAVAKEQQTKDSAMRCALAWQRTREIQGIYVKYGAKDSLAREEIVNYAKRELKYTVTKELLDNIWRDYVAEGERGIKIEQHHLLKSAIGIARELERNAARKAARVEKEKVIEEMKAELHEKARAASVPVDEAQEGVDKLERHVNPLAIKARTMPSAKMGTVCDQCERMTEEVKASVEKAKDHLEHLGEDYTDKFKEEIKTFLKAETKQLELKLGRMERRLIRATNLVKQFRTRIDEQKKAEMNRLRKAARTILRNNQQLRSITVEELFKSIDTNNDGEIDEKEFLAFFESANKDIDMKDLEDEQDEATLASEAAGKLLEEAKRKLLEGDAEPKEEPEAETTEAREAKKEDGKDEGKEAEASKGGEGDNADDESGGQVDLSQESLAKLFAFLLQDDTKTLSKDNFMQLVRVYYQVVKATVIADRRSISDCQTVRRLDLKEVVEVLEGPYREDNNAKRVFARAMKDDKEGWITTLGNLGTVFLKEGGTTWRVIRETVLTEGFDINEKREPSETKDGLPRKLKPGELLDLCEWPRKSDPSGSTRMKCKVRSDGTVGWVTTAGSQGTFAILI